MKWYQIFLNGDIIIKNIYENYTTILANSKENLQIL